jgi:hypothetical protein
MPPLQVKDCPTDVYERLRACAREENRSIAQQTLTIIEDYLDMRDGLKTIEETRSRRLKPSSVRVVDDTDYLTRRLETLARIDELRPIPITEATPSSVEILAQIRREEAR